MLPLLGLIAVILYRPETEEPERRCPRCGKVHKLYVQVCTRCGAELYLPDPSEVDRPAERRAEGGERSRLAQFVGAPRHDLAKSCTSAAVPAAHRSQVRTIAFAKPSP